MEVSKEIKKYGNSAVVVLTKEDMRILGVELGSVVRVSPIPNKQKISSKVENE